MKYTDKIVSIIKLMEDNKYLLPDNWSESAQLGTDEYKTYVGSRGDFRYIVIEITEKMSISIDGNKVEITHDLELSNVNKKALNYIKEIYKQKHSFENYNEGEKELARKIIKTKKEITNLDKELKDFKKQYDDSKMIKQEKIINGKND